MSDQHLRNTLLQAAEIPPARVWETVAAALDVAAEDERMCLQLSQLNAAPPAEAWAQIEQQLWDADLQTQALAAIDLPPAGSWPAIEGQLTATWDAKVKQQLQLATVSVPADNWQRIEERLNQDAGAKVVPITSFTKSWIRWAAAAAISGLLLWGGVQLFTNDKNVSVVASQQAIAPAPEVPLPVEEAQPNPFNAGAAVTATKSNGLAAKAAAQHQQAAGLSTSRKTPHNSTVTPVAATAFDEDQYLLVMNDDGEIIRVSRKIHRLACASDIEELTVDATAALASRACYRQIKEWQQKIATTAALSSLTGFIDVNELIGAVEK